jgi:hypothetical protein
VCVCVCVRACGVGWGGVLTFINREVFEPCASAICFTPRLAFR